jgi:hypothetical protein
VKRQVLLGDADDLILQNDLEIFFRDRQGDVFGTLEDAERRAIDARSLPVDLGFTAESIEQFPTYRTPTSRASSV